MNALLSLFSTQLPRPRNRDIVISMAARPARHERAVGVGYGSSSGYASAARYTTGSALPRFRFH